MQGDRAMELELPFEDGAAGELASRRLGHLREIVGDDSDALIRLAAAFSNLAAIYAAPEEELARVVGPVAAARIRWFLDAPLATSLAPRHLRALARAA
jgi:ubiquinone biosynthesis protein UbiJ